jgi:hypothetical protein
MLDGSYMCDECEPGYYSDPEDGYCYECSESLDNCLQCRGKFDCTLCERNADIFYGQCLDISPIPGCKKLNGDDATICDECMFGYGLSKSGDSCGLCQSIDEGCYECTFDEDGGPDQCLSCYKPMYLAEGSCYWNECNFYLYSARAVSCYDCG